MIKTRFKDKEITLMGLGLLGRGLGLAKFLVQSGANLTITDLKTKKQLEPSLKQLKKFRNIKYVLGRHRLADFKNKDLIIKAAGVPLDSIYIKEARKNKIPIEMDASLFVKLAPVKTIGITGTRGKSTVTDIVYQILKKHYKKGNVFLGGNIKGIATLPLLKKVKKEDIVVMELDSWQLQGFGDSKVSPYISVFTNFLNDHMNYYGNSMARYFNDKANIFKYQNRNDCLIVSPQAREEIKKRFKGKIKSGVIQVKKNKRETKLIGEHNQMNISLAVEVLRILGIGRTEIKKQLKTYSGMPGRLEFIKTIKGVSYYNDTNSTTPDALMAALNSFDKKVILIAGGNDKELDYKEAVKIINKKSRKTILIQGTATDKMLEIIDLPVDLVDNMKKAVDIASRYARRGDIVLLSPGAASFGVFKNEYDRGDQFNEYVLNLKPSETILGNVKKAHFVGIGGIGVSAIARMALLQKTKVSGSDISKNIVNQRIKKLGGQVFIGHRKSNLAKDTDIVIYSPAVKSNNPELVKAKELEIPTYSYPQALGLISKEKYTIALSGTHGKTTTTAMLAEAMITAKKDPTVIIGSFLRKQKDNFVPGKSKYFVVEACEYKKSFLNIDPDVLVITNVDNDHLDYFKTFKNIQKTFAQLVKKVPKEGYVVCNPKDLKVKPVLKSAKAKIIDYTKEKKLKLQVPGEHNIQNAQAVLAVAKVLKFKQEAEKSLKKYLGVWRRFEFKGKTKKGALIYDDYAHHPSEIKTTIQAAREKFPKQRIFVVFQPHLYSRTKLLLKDFARSFNQADQVIVPDIYAARENNRIIHSKDLVEEIKKYNPFVFYEPDFKKISQYLKKETSKNDLVITMGAGDVYEIGEMLV